MSEICGISYESSEIVKRRLSHIFGQHFEQDRHSLQLTETIVVRFLHSFILPVNRA
jgi:hypothetical protein